jgi:Uma2 family endonuclease
MAVQLTRRQFTVDDYYAMLRAGILSPDDRVELIDGEIVEMPPMGPGHAGSIGSVTSLLIRLFGDRAQLRVQCPVRLGRFDEPEPDLALVRVRADSYRTAHPTPADVFLVIEVSDTTLATDRGTKMPLYARAGLPEAWILDLQHDLVLVHREPTPEGYRLVSTACLGDRLSPLAFPDCELAVDDLLS